MYKHTTLECHSNWIIMDISKLIPSSHRRELSGQNLSNYCKTSQIFF